MPTTLDQSVAATDAPAAHATSKGARSALTSPGARVSLADCRQPGSDLQTLVSDIANRYNVEARALTVRALLHLPRLARPDGSLSRAGLQREVLRLAGPLREDQELCRDLAPSGKPALADLTFATVESDVAERVFSRMHYLRGSRPDALNFGLIDATGLPVTLCSVSALEWTRVAGRLAPQFSVDAARIWDVSRVYSWGAAPAYAISFMLGRLRSELRKPQYAVDLLSTAVDPNLGFTGTSYRASNWEHWVTMQPRPYLYCDAKSLTPRQLRASFGTSNLDDLQNEYPHHRFEKSNSRLLDSLIFCCRLKGSTPAPDRVPVLHR